MYISLSLSIYISLSLSIYIYILYTSTMPRFTSPDIGQPSFEIIGPDSGLDAEDGDRSCYDTPMPKSCSVCVYIYIYIYI